MQDSQSTVRILRRLRSNDATIRKSEVAFVIDAQGFYINKIFYPREVAVKNDESLWFMEFDVPDTELSATDKKSVEYCTKHVHGIPFESGTVLLPYNTFENILMHFYEKLSTSNQIFIVCKNNYLQSSLEKMGLPVLEYKDAIMDHGNIIPCDNNHQGKKCAVIKVQQIYNDLL